MLSFGRVIGAFIGMMILGYMAIVVLVPAPSTATQRPEELMSGRSAAVRLSEEAQALVSKKPPANLQ